MKKIRFFLSLALCLALLTSVLCVAAQAKDLDEIQKYTITVNVNDAEDTDCPLNRPCVTVY